MTRIHRGSGHSTAGQPAVCGRCAAVMQQSALRFALWMDLSSVYYWGGCYYYTRNTRFSNSKSIEPGAGTCARITAAV